MTETFEAAIAELKTRRDKIDSAIEALEGLNGQEPRAKSQEPRAKSQEPRAKSVKASPASVKTRTVRKSDSGEPTNRELVMQCLMSGPKRAGAVVKALKGKVSDANVYANLNYLKAHGEVKKNPEDATFELVD